ncbi:MAG: RHS repeat-associated core domain-containing protein [Verrucomicrobiota bacterium]|nr:RHS repeat-associated core domain-containing protein [Verrucomicrobiota bacterium]
MSNGVPTYYAYDGERPILEYDIDPQSNQIRVLARNTYGIGIDEILMRDTGTQYYYHQDRLGNVSAVTNAYGQVAEQYSYDAFGQPTVYGPPGANNPRGTEPTNHKSQISNRFLFTGREWAAEYGFYEYRNRAYNPALGRFMSEDPKGFAAGDRNLFRYCGGDPVNRTDPMGLEQFGNLEEAINFARAQVRELALGPNAQKEILQGHGLKTHSVGVGISVQSGTGKYVTATPSYGQFKLDSELDSVGRLKPKVDAAGKPVCYETETYPSAAFMKIHSHNIRPA